MKYVTPSSLFQTFTGESGLYRVRLRPRHLDLLVEWTESPTVLISFHARVQRPITPPVFTGRTITEGLPCSRIFVSDPSLVMDPTLSLAWFTGGRNFPFDAVLAEVLGFLTRGKVAILFGISGGGFAAMKYGAAIENSVALAVNPQTIIPHYNWDDVGPYMRIVHGEETNRERALEEHPELTLQPRGKVAYLQNPDDWHVNRHLAPFLAAGGHALPPPTAGATSVLGEIVLHYGEGWVPGHHPPEPKFLKNLIRVLVNHTNLHGRAHMAGLAKAINDTSTWYNWKLASPPATS